MRFALPLITALACPIAVSAHPHVFVKAEVTVVFDPSGAVGVQMNWIYDDLFSLLVTSDLGLDVDGDLMLTAAEQMILDEQIAAWPPDYEGDLEVSQNGTLLALSEKRDHRMTYEGGIFTEAHLRPVAEIAAPDAPLHIRVYDPSFYTAYDLQRPVQIIGRDDCTAEVIAADLDAAYALAESLNAQVGAADSDPDAYFPAIGDAFADTIVVTCAGPL